LRERARLLGLSDSEVARRAGLGDRRYAHYVTDAREPDLATLLKISRTLDVTPNDLLGVSTGHTEPTERERLVSELQSVISALSDEGIRIAIRQSAVLIDYHRDKFGSE
jgi:transcriptional regulator with XRE-family HTH domain